MIIHNKKQLSEINNANKIDESLKSSELSIYLDNNECCTYIIDILQRIWNILALFF